MLNKNSLGLLKKGAAKQSRIKSIAWHLRWLVRTRADISLRPSGLVRPRTDIKLRPSAFVRTRTDFKLQTVGMGRSFVYITHGSVTRPTLLGRATHYRES